MRQAKRSIEVLSILARNGFADLVDTLRSGMGGGHGERSAVREEQHTSPATRAERIRTVVEELGPTYVKLGQVLSTRSDLVPPDVLIELAKLQDRVGPFPFEAVRSIVEAELGRPLETVFESFDSAPIASGSLGQVHRARLNGQDVAVKVQRPEIRETIEADIRVMSQLATQLERHVAGWAIHKPTRAVKDFAQTITEELDYKIEASHQDRLEARFKDDPTVRVPRVIREATTSRILTMEFIDGIKVSDLQGLRAAGTDFEEVARRGFRFVLEQTLVDGFFHADPHPGNVFVLPNNVVSFIDYGMMGRLSQRVRDDFVELVHHVIEKNPSRVTESILRLTISEDSVVVPELERDVARTMDLYIGRPLREMDLSNLLGELLSALARHRLRVPPDLFLMLKAIAQIEASAVALAPEFDVVEEAKPHVRRVFMDRFRPNRVVEDAANVSREFVQLLRDTPSLLREFSRVATGGGIRVRLEQEHMPEMLSAGNRIANRLAFALVLGASLVGSAILAAAKIPPTWHGISLLGIGGFLATMVMSAWLLGSILRHGRL